MLSFLLDILLLIFVVVFLVAVVAVLLGIGIAVLGMWDQDFDNHYGSLGYKLVLTGLAGASIFGMGGGIVANLSEGLDKKSA